MGDGRNAIYLAEQGFEVTGIDSSEVAVRRCLDVANERAVVINAMPKI